MINFTKTLITPSIAQELLNNNEGNRNMKESVVSKYSRDMKEGRWKEDTGETIKISKSGRVLDGQHRLAAIVQAKVSVFMHIAKNIEEEVFDVIDTGSNRSAGDIFSSQGIPCSTAVTAIMTSYNRLKLGYQTAEKINTKYTNAMLLVQYYKDVLFWNTVTRQSLNWYVSFSRILAPSYIGGFYALFYELAPDKAESFMNQLTTGRNIENDVINQLRNKLMQDKLSQKRLKASSKSALIIKTWNYFIKDSAVKILSFKPESEEYPVAKRKELIEPKTTPSDVDVTKEYPIQMMLQNSVVNQFLISKG